MMDMNSSIVTRDRAVNEAMRAFEKTAAPLDDAFFTAALSQLREHVTAAHECAQLRRACDRPVPRDWADEERDNG